jgi:hypothetical protein
MPALPVVALQALNPAVSGKKTTNDYPRGLVRTRLRPCRPKGICGFSPGSAPDWIGATDKATVSLELTAVWRAEAAIGVVMT